MNYRETDDAWRLYRREWVIVHTITCTDIDSDAAVDTARQWIEANLRGRVKDEEFDVELNIDDPDNPTAMWCHIKVFKDNLKGEFKHVENAQAYAALKQYDEFVIVPRNSKSDHDIRNYGIVKL